MHRSPSRWKLPYYNTEASVLKAYKMYDSIKLFFITVLVCAIFLPQESAICKWACWQTTFLFYLVSILHFQIYFLGVFINQALKKTMTWGKMNASHPVTMLHYGFTTMCCTTQCVALCYFHPHYAALLDYLDRVMHNSCTIK